VGWRVKNFYDSSKFSIASILNKLIALALGINWCVGVASVFVSKKHTPTDLAYSLSWPIYFLMGTFTYVYLGKYCQEFIDLLKSWKQMRPLYFASYPLHLTDVNLFRDSNLVAGLIYTSAILQYLLLFGLQSDSK
jgi:hypothetical protein